MTLLSKPQLEIWGINRRMLWVAHVTRGLGAVFTLSLLTLLIIWSDSTQALQRQNEFCRGQSFGESDRISDQALKNFLDCLSRQPQLSKLSAQWILLRLSHWDIEHWAMGSEYAHKLKDDNPMDPNVFNKLYLDLNAYSSHPSSLLSLLSYLEQVVFPEALRGFASTDSHNLSSLSFESSMYQHIAFAETPVRGLWSGPEGLNRMYRGTLLESQNFRSWNWLEDSSRQFPALSLNPTGVLYRGTSSRPHFWTQIHEQFKKLKPCPESRCLMRQERAVGQGLFMALGHPDLINKVHFQKLPGFGPQLRPEDPSYIGNLYPGSQEMLPQDYGCERPEFFQSSVSGFSGREYSAVEDRSEWGWDVSQYSRWGLLGRSIYIEALNKQDININMEIPGQFQGQNAIVREISPAAVEHFIELGGFGSEGIRDLQRSQDHRGQPWGLIPFSGKSLLQTLDSIIDQRLFLSHSRPGISFLIADYLRRKYQGQDVREHVVNRGVFFQETILSYGWTFSEWINRLYGWNPGVYYYVYMYDHGFRASAGRRVWKTYYDRVVQVAQAQFPDFEF